EETERLRRELTGRKIDLLIARRAARFRDEVLDWRKELERWLEPFLVRLGHKTRRRIQLMNTSRFRSANADRNDVRLGSNGEELALRVASPLLPQLPT